MGRAIAHWLKYAADNSSDWTHNEKAVNDWFDAYTDRVKTDKNPDLDTMLDLSAKYNLYNRPINTETLQLLNESKPLMDSGAYNKYLRADNTMVLNKLLDLATNAKIQSPDDQKMKDLHRRIQEAQDVNLYVDDPDYEVTDEIWSRYKPTPWQIERYNKLKDVENSPEYAAAGGVFGSLFGPSNKQKKLLEQKARAAWPVSRWLSEGK